MVVMRVKGTLAAWSKAFARAKSLLEVGRSELKRTGDEWKKIRRN